MRSGVVYDICAHVVGSLYRTELMTKAGAMQSMVCGDVDTVQ